MNNWEKVVDRIAVLERDIARLKLIEKTGVWTDWTPTWTAATTNPVLGSDGVLSGRYFRVGTTVKCRLRLTIGSKTTTGVGAWRFDYPVAPNTTYANLYQVGSAWLYNADGTNTVGVTNYGGATFWAVFSPTAVTATNPFTWAEGDILEVNFDYEAA